MSIHSPREHSTHYREMACRSDRSSVMTHPDGYGKRKGVCGDSVEMFIHVQDDIIQAVSFLIDGCIDTNASANTVAHLVEGKSTDAAWEITPSDVINYLKTLLPEKHHCAELATGTLYQALRNYSELKRAPWKKIYNGF